MNKKIMKIMEFRQNLSEALENVRFRDMEIIIMHYDKPVAKVSKLTDDEISNIEKELKNEQK